ncbi:MAG: T9SS type A sorting domain-containing protein [Bacteroidota bacterium]
MTRNISLILVCLLTVGPSSLAQLTFTPGNTISATVDETSGLARGNGSFWTHNDSGGNPELYELDSAGTLLRTLFIDNANNVDWEELTQDDAGNFYIGDFGNNGNARQNQRIYKIPNPDSISSDTVSAEIISLSYADQPGFPPPNNRRHYDMEAMIWTGGNLFLFSKNRTSPFDGYTRLYQLPDTAGTYSVSPIDSFYTGPGPQTSYWITAADINEEDTKLVLISYDRLWLFSCWDGNNFFDGTVQELTYNIFAQYEGVVFKNDSTLVFSSEDGFGTTQSFWEVSIAGFGAAPTIDLGPDVSTTSESVTLAIGMVPSDCTPVWSNGSIGNQIVVDSSGEYILTLECGNCRGRDTIEISLLCENFEASIGADDPTCFAEDNGFIDLNVANGNGPLSYQWSSGDTTQDITNAAAGNYMVTITDSAGCELQTDVTLIEPSELIISVISQLDSMNNTGSATVVVSGGTPPYQFNWSDGSTDSVRTGLAGGDYELTVTDANSCSIIDSLSIELINALEMWPELENISVFPNPTTSESQVHLTFSQVKNPRVQIVDLQGKLIWEKQLSPATVHDVELPTADISAGMYLLQIEVDGRRLGRKLVKQ